MASDPDTNSSTDYQPIGVPVFDDPLIREQQRERLRQSVREYEREHGPLPEAEVAALAERASRWPD